MKYRDLLKNAKKCPFCSPEKGRVIIQNSKAYLTYAVAPYHNDHLMVIPKRHVEKLLELTTLEIKDLDTMVRKALKILKNLGYKNLSILIRQGEKSGRTVSHIHYNIIPNTIIGNMNPKFKHGNRKVLTKSQKNILIKRINATL